MRSHNDQLETLLDRFETKLKNDLTQIITQTAHKVVQDILINTSNPLPTGITGKSREEALQILNEAGFNVEFEPEIPAHTRGKVIECIRKADDSMTVILRIRYEMPLVIGMAQEAALKEMDVAGFHAVIEYRNNDSSEPDHVFKVNREGNSLNVVLYVKPNNAMNAEDIYGVLVQKENSIEMLRLFETLGVDIEKEPYLSIHNALKSRAEFESVYGSDKSVTLSLLQKAIDNIA